VLAIMAVKAAAAFSICPTSFIPMYLQDFVKSDLSGCLPHLASEPTRVQAAPQCTAL
jgi:hypothetical protein